MTVSQILSYVTALISELGMTPFIQAGVIITLAIAGIGAVITMIRNR